MPTTEPDKASCSLNGSCFHYCTCNNKNLFLEGTKLFLTASALVTSPVPLNASAPQGTVWDSSLSMVTSLLYSACQTPLNKLFQFSARLLPMKAAMWSHYLLTKGIPGLNWAPNLMLVLLYPWHLLLLGCVLLQAILYRLLFPSHSPPPTPVAIISYFSDSTYRPSPRPWTGNFTACYNFAFVIRNIGQASKAPFSPFPLFRFYNHPLLCNLHYLNLEVPDFYLRQQDTRAL